jgi:hypothetical protein
MSPLSKRRRLLIGIGLAAFVLNGCGYFIQARRETKKMAREIIATDKNFRKTVAIAPFRNQTYYKRVDIDSVFQTRLIDILESACPKLLVFKPESKQYPAFMMDLPRKAGGKIDNLKVALNARPYGLDGVVTGTVVDIGAYEDKRGIAWMRDTHYFVQIQILVELFDTETGAKLLDEHFIREVEVDETDHLLVKQGKQAPIPEIPETLERIATELGEKICDALSSQRWKSYIVSKEGDRFVISSGQRSGLKPGTVLEVYPSTEMVSGIGEERFFVPGMKHAEVEIVQAESDRSEAVLKSGGDVQVGCAVKVK